MGLFMDYLDQHRENSFIDPCMILPSTGGGYGTPPQPRIREDHKDKKIEIISFPDQRRSLWHGYSMEPSAVFIDYDSLCRQAYALHRQCVLREKYLLSIQNSLKLSTYVANDVLNEYLQLVKENMIHARQTFSETKKQASPNLQLSWDDSLCDNYVASKVMVDALFFYLTKIADFDDSQFTKNLFSDIALLINTGGVSSCERNRAKDICRSYFEDTYHPTQGIDRCENCGAVLYRECSYCFNCFERS